MDQQQMKNAMERLRKSYTEYSGQEPSADIINTLARIINYVDARCSEGATPYEAWNEVLLCMRDTAARAARAAR